MERRILSKKLKNFETSDWKNKASRNIEGTICQLQIIRSAIAFSPNKIDLILKIESKLLERLRLGNSDNFINFLPFIYARQIISNFL